MRTTKSDVTTSSPFRSACILGLALAGSLAACGNKGPLIQADKAEQAAAKKAHKTDDAPAAPEAEKH